MRILDLGCGYNKVEGAVGLDNIALTGVDIVHDLLHFPYPIKANSFDTIYLRHVIEHFNIDKINNIMNECYRILKKDGQLYNLSERYEKVSEYDKYKKRCWIRLKGEYAVFNVIKGLFSDDFYEKQEDGAYKKVDIEYFTFPCIKQ